MATIDSAVDEVITELRKITTLRRVPDNPPETNDMYPFATVVARSGAFHTRASGEYAGLHNIEIHLHVQRMQGGLSKAYDDIIALVSSIPEQLFANLGSYSAIDTWEGDINYEFVHSEWNEVDTLAYIFTMENVKVMGDYS